MTESIIRLDAVVGILSSFLGGLISGLGITFLDMALSTSIYFYSSDYPSLGIVGIFFLVCGLLLIGYGLRDCSFGFC